MVCVTISCPGGDIDTPLAVAAFAELAGVQEEADQLRLWLANDDDAAELAARLAPWNPRIERVEQRNWNENWQSEWTPITVGRRFYLAPPGDESATPAGRIRLTMHPGNAFGNGDHPTTHLCLIAMERELRPGDTFLDVGCGSGLLGEAAHALGAGRVYGCDLDGAGVRPGAAAAFIGSVNAVRSDSCHYVVANIQAGVLVDLLPDLARVMKPGGRGVLSGVTGDQVAGLRRAAAAVGLTCAPHPDELCEWAAIGVSYWPGGTR